MSIHCRWTLKPEFGEVPQYLVKNKQQIAEEKARVEEHLRLRQQQVGHCQTLQMCKYLALDCRLTDAMHLNYSGFVPEHVCQPLIFQWICFVHPHSHLKAFLDQWEA